MEAIRERANGARRRVGRALVDAKKYAMDPANTPTLGALVLLIAVSRMNPTSESFHAECAESGLIRKTFLDAVTMRTNAWTCSNQGAMRSLRLSSPAYTYHDMFLVSVVRTTREAKQFVGILGTWIGVPRPLNFLVTVVVYLYRVHATVVALLLLGIVGLVALKAVKMIKLIVVGSLGAVGAVVVVPKLFGAPLWAIALSGGIWGYLYKQKRLDGLVRVLKAVAPKPKPRKGHPPPPPPPPPRR